MYKPGGPRLVPPQPQRRQGLVALRRRAERPRPRPTQPCNSHAIIIIIFIYNFNQNFIQIQLACHVSLRRPAPARPRPAMHPQCMVMHNLSRGSMVPGPGGRRCGRVEGGRAGRTDVTVGGRVQGGRVCVCDGCVCVCV